MNQNNYMKGLSIIGFLVFGAVSCWATAESLHLLLSSWPVAFCWAITIGFFIIASLGTKMIADSLNQRIFVENRGMKFSLGIIIVFVFWLCCSLPTNTHTFFYRNLINDKVTYEIATTKGYLDQIANGVVTADKTNARITEFINQINMKLGQLRCFATNIEK